MSGVRARIIGVHRAVGPRLTIALGAALAALAVAAVVAISASGSGRSPRHVPVSGPTPSGPGAGATNGPARTVRRSRAHRRAARAAHHRAAGTTRHSHPHHAAAQTTSTTAGSPPSSTTSTGTPAQPSSAPLTVVLHGGGDATIDACGETHHYKTFAVATTMPYSGAVSHIPTGHWKVKLKIKVCQGGQFVDFQKFDAQQRNKHAGTFSGTFRAPPAGLYYVRAVLYVNGSEVGESDKRHFETR
jgi:hypothetical protein